MKSLFIALLAVIALVPLKAQAQTWTVTRTEWTSQDEDDYSRFVAAVGDAKEKNLCHTTQECITKAPGNFLRTAEDAKMSFQVDCAYLPYVLRAYFAMKRGLPFSYVSSIRPAADPQGNTPVVNDIRYSSWGNIPTSRFDIVRGSISFSRALSGIRNGVSTGVFRMHPEYDSATLPQDMYSVDIRKSDGQGIRAGTNIYDPAGHVAVVYKIGKSGRIFYVDAHPDDSMTRGSFGMKFVRARPTSGAGFKNFRPLKVVGGRAVLAMNHEIPDFSTVQFFGTNPSPKKWSDGKFVFNGETVDYYEYVRTIMADGNQSVDPLNEMYEMMDGLCLDLKDRGLAIAGAVKNGLPLKSAPVRLPYNIYGTGGEWESFATPSRDARLKTSFEELHDAILRWQTEIGTAKLSYAGTNLKADLTGVYNKMVGQCRLQYKNSQGQAVRFTMNDVQDHLFDLSFSPYDCTEVRWGGIGGGASTTPACTADPAKVTWYKALRKLRNQMERTYDIRMDYTAQELLNGPGAQLGVENAPSVDLRSALK